MGDHATLRRGLNILDAMIKKLEGGERIEIADVNALLKFFRVFGEEYHHTVEEKALFPILMRAASEGSPIHLLVLEHGEERALVAWMSEAIGARRVADFAYTSRRLSMMLRSHLEREETIFGQLASQVMSPEVDEAVAAAFTGNYLDPSTFVNFARLERKYMPKKEGIVLDPLLELRRGREAPPLQ
jgi:hemerythrin-like domain-containing protein